MSPRRRDREGKEHKRVDIDMEEIAHFVNVLSICSGALLIVSLAAFLLTGSQAGTDVIYTMVIGINTAAFMIGRLFVKKYGKKD